ncbi:hypothetical protein CABS03_13755 [Colletotrichum abscissum]
MDADSIRDRVLPKNTNAPSFKVKLCDSALRRLVLWMNDDVHKESMTRLRSLWEEWRAWVCKLFDREFSSKLTDSLDGGAAFDLKVSERISERDMFVLDMENLYSSIDVVRRMLIESGPNRMRDPKATYKDPLVVNQKTIREEDKTIGPRSDLGYYLTFAIPARLLLVQSAAARFSNDDKQDDADLALVLSQKNIERQLVTCLF